MNPQWYHADGTACGHGGPLAADPGTCRGGQPVGWVQLAFPDTEPADPGQ